MPIEREQLESLISQLRQRASSVSSASAPIECSVEESHVWAIGQEEAFHAAADEIAALLDK